MANSAAPQSMPTWASGTPATSPSIPSRSARSRAASLSASAGGCARRLVNQLLPTSGENRHGPHQSIDGSCHRGTTWTRQGLVDELLERGAAKVYATARAPKASQDPLDVNDPDSVAALAKTAADADIVVNNAGTLSGNSLLNSGIEDIRAVFETNYFGPLRIAQGIRADPGPQWRWRTGRHPFGAVLGGGFGPLRRLEGVVLVGHQHVAHRTAGSAHEAALSGPVEGLQSREPVSRPRPTARGSACQRNPRRRMAWWVNPSSGCRPDR